MMNIAYKVFVKDTHGNLRSANYGLNENLRNKVDANNEYPICLKYCTYTITHKQDGCGPIMVFDRLYHASNFYEYIIFLYPKKDVFIYCCEIPNKTRDISYVFVLPDLIKNITGNRYSVRRALASLKSFWSRRNKENIKLDIIGAPSGSLGVDWVRPLHSVCV